MEPKAGAMWVYIIIGLFMLIRGVFVSDTATITAVEKQGYSNVQIESKIPVVACFFGADAQDAVVYKMQVTNPAGQRVEIDACSGWLFKGVTIRTRG